MQIVDIDFSGKIVSFGTAGDTLAIKNPKFEVQFERIFVVGVIPDGATNYDWAVERPCAVAWDSVTDYLVFDSEEKFRELIDKSK